MEGEDNADVVLFCYVGQGLEDGLEALRIVGVVVTVDGGEDVGTGLEVEVLHDGAALAGEGGEVHAVVVHDVTTVANTAVFAVAEGGGAVVETFVAEVVDSSLGGGEADAGELVADDAVDFFGHGHVEGTETGLDMEHRDVDFGGGHGTGEGGVGVAIEDDAVEGVF